MLRQFDSTPPGSEPRRVKPDEAHSASRSGHALLVDVRDAHLYENAHLDPSVSVSWAEIEATRRLPERVSAPDDALLILYCA